MFVQACVCVHASVRASVYPCLDSSLCVPCVRSSVCMCMYVHVCLRVSTCVCVPPCAPVCVHLCMRA